MHEWQDLRFKIDSKSQIFSKNFFMAILFAEEIVF